MNQPKESAINYEEYYALTHGISERLSLESYFAENALEEVQTANVSEDRKCEITSAARRLLQDIETLRGHIERREIGLAVMIAMDVGFWPERIVRLYFQRDVERMNRSQGGLGKGREKKATGVEQRYRTIRAKVTARMKSHPRDSLTYAREFVAAEMGVALNTVKAATVGLKKPRKKMK